MVFFFTLEKSRLCWNTSATCSITAQFLQDQSARSRNLTILSMAQILDLRYYIVNTWKKLNILCLTDQRQKTKQQNYKSARKSQSFQMRGRTCRFWHNRRIALSLFLFPLILEAWRKGTLTFGKIVLSWSFQNFTWLEARAFIPLCVSCHSASDGCFKENVVWFLVCGYFIPDWGTLSDF